MPRITVNIPSQNINTANWSITNNINLADSTFYIPDKIVLLIGASIILSGKIIIHKSLPIIMGRNISGKLDSSLANNESYIK